MSLTPVYVDWNYRISTGDVVISSFSADEDDLLHAWVVTKNATTPDVPTGHGTWSQIGFSEVSSNGGTVHLFACIVTSTGSATVTTARATSGLMGVSIYKTPGADVSSGVSSTYSQVKQSNQTSTTNFTITFDTTVTNTTMHFYGGSNGKHMTGDDTELKEGRYYYDLRTLVEYSSAGNDSPAAAPDTASTGCTLVIELVDAGGGGGPVVPIFMNSYRQRR